MEWISVTEQMPKPMRQFSLFLVNTPEGVGVSTYDNIYGFGHITISGNVQHSSLVVTHWMTLPEPPK